jgi:hypothetical protein
MNVREIAEHEAGHIWWFLMFYPGRKVNYYNFKHRDAKKNIDCKKFLKKLNVERGKILLGCADVHYKNAPYKMDAELCLSGIITSKILDHKIWRDNISSGGYGDLNNAINVLRRNEVSKRDLDRIIKQVERTIRDNIENIIFLSKFLEPYPTVSYKKIKAFWDGRIPIYR